MTTPESLLAAALHEAGVRCSPNIPYCRASHRGHSERILATPEGARLLAAAEVGLAVERLMGALPGGKVQLQSHENWREEDRYWARIERVRPGTKQRYDRLNGLGPTLVAAIDAALEDTP